MNNTEKSIVLFDGLCNFCNGSVKFIIKRDPKSYFQFASLQGSKGMEILHHYDLDGYSGSILLIDRGRLFLKSGAALRICKHLSGFWKLGYLLLVIPGPVRDWAYDFIADHRYRWFGKRDSCMIPPAEIRDRFLD